jgi:hypothetical protein
MSFLMLPRRHASSAAGLLLARRDHSVVDGRPPPRFGAFPSWDMFPLRSTACAQLPGRSFSCQCRDDYRPGLYIGIVSSKVSSTAAKTNVRPVLDPVASELETSQPSAASRNWQVNETPASWLLPIGRMGYSLPEGLWGGGVGGGKTWGCTLL